jgi:hypothetical protein
MLTQILGRPGVSDERQATYGFVFLGGMVQYLAGGKVIDGARSRNPNGAGNLALTLPPGLLLGKITASGRYAPSVIGVTQGAYTSGGTSLTLTAPQAVELVRRVGASGTFNLVGPATAAGSNNITQVTYSAVNQTTGVVTITNIGANRVAGCLVCPEDGSQIPLTLVPDGIGILLANDNRHTEFSQVPIGGQILSTNIQNWPADTTLRSWVRDNLSTTSGGKFLFSDRY